MAKRQAARIDDTQRVLEIRNEGVSDGSGGFTYTSLLTAHVPDLLMRANRRQYTQCRAYDFRLKIGLIDSSTEGLYEIYTLSNAWWVKRSIEMAKGVFLDATKKERALLGDNAAKYHDFIIDTHAGAAGANMAKLMSYVPATSGDDMTDSEVTTDESVYEGSRLGTVIGDKGGDEMGFTTLAEDIIGDGKFNIFNQYLLSRSIDSETDARAGPYGELLGMDDEAFASLQKDGDLTPWDHDAFPSPFMLQDVITVDQGIAAGSTRSSRTITAPLGVFFVKKMSPAGAESNYTGNEKLLLEVRKGTYKGVHAPAYKAMKGIHRGLA